MISAKKIESFCIDPTERFIFSGNYSGQISVIEIDSFKPVAEVSAHPGSIIAIACHRHLPYIAALGGDRAVSIWKYSQGGNIERICTISIRSIKASNDEVEIAPIQSTSQALGFHDTLPRLVTRTGNSSVAEIDFDEHGNFSLIRAVRHHGDDDLLSARFVRDSDMVLSGSIRGDLVLADAGNVVRRWQVGWVGVHWVEELGGEDYLIASDTRFVGRISLSSDELLTGDMFTRDDLEYVTYNRNSGRAFVGSFDRNIYEIDPKTCNPIRVVFHAPFKCRWVKTLERDPSVMVVQCRNGALYKVDLTKNTAVAVIKETPDALWTVARTAPDELQFAGEGNTITKLKFKEVDDRTRMPRFACTSQSLAIEPGEYTKRMCLHEPSGTIILARNNGQIVLVKDDRVQGMVSLESAVRDVACTKTGSELFACTEDGKLHAIDLDSKKIKRTFTSSDNQPLWALAFNEDCSIIAVAERRGYVYILDTNNFKVIMTMESIRPKRLKWCDEDTLLFNKSDELWAYSHSLSTVSKRMSSVGNTVEDFIWDEDKLYLIAINYNQDITMCDFTTGEVICSVPDQLDISKGLAWLDCGSRKHAYPLDFITFGRSGCAHMFRVHDDKILALGPIREMIAPAGN